MLKPLASSEMAVHAYSVRNRNKSFVAYHCYLRYVHLVTVKQMIIIETYIFCIMLMDGLMTNFNKPFTFTSTSNFKPVNRNS